MIPVQNVYYMLAYAFQVLNEQGYKNIASEQFNNVAELCAAILSKGISVQLKRGLGREYIPETDALSAIRGKIDISESIKTRTMLKKQLVCAYDDFSVNSYMNQVKGVVLGFDLEWFKNLKKQMPHPSSKQSQAVGHDSALYHNKSLEDAFYNICYNCIREYGLSAWVMGIRPTFKHYSAFIKNPTFIGEQEERIVYYPESHEPHPDNDLKISELVETPFPHYCLPWTNGNGDNALKAIGLGCNCDLTQEKIKEIMTAAGLAGEFQLFKSECSYRLR